MKTLKPAVISLVILFVCGSLPLRAADRDSGAWSSRMQALYATLAGILTDVSSDRRFNDPANRDRIEREAAKLASLAHEMRKHEIAGQDSDPSIPMLAAIFARDTRDAVSELKEGHRSYARGILRAVPSYCIACHTRNASGPRFAQLPLEPTSKDLSALERGEFYAATRQFDRAQGEFIRLINDPQVAGAYDFNWERAIHQSLAIAVRVNQDPKQAQDIVHSILGMRNAPASILEAAKTWNASIEEWKAEPPHKALTEEGLRAEAMRLLARAREIQKYPMDRDADIVYLRASAATHDLLQASPRADHTAEAFLLAGIAYEVLSPLPADDLHEVYYEACIRVEPHSRDAATCYRRLEQSVLFGFSGSSGVDLPSDVREKLIELKQLASPATPAEAGAP